MKSLWQELQEQLNAAFHNSRESRKSPEAGDQKRNSEWKNLTLRFMCFVFSNPFLSYIYNIHMVYIYVIIHISYIYIYIYYIIYI